MFVATAVIAIAAILTEGNSTRGQGHCQNCGNNRFSFHTDLQLIVNCQTYPAASCAAPCPVLKLQPLLPRSFNGTHGRNAVRDLPWRGLRRGAGRKHSGCRQTTQKFRVHDLHSFLWPYA
jgi:hypothetical protein